MTWRWGHLPVTWSSHHLLLLLSSRIGDKLTSEDEPYVDVHYFNISTVFQIGDASPSAYVICICNSFWWDEMVSLVDVAAGDLILLILILCILERTLISANVLIHVMFLWKTFLKRYQFVLHLLGEPTR